MKKRYNFTLFIVGSIMLLTACSKSSDQISLSSNESGGRNIGVGGSMARFAIMNDYLYVVDNNNLYLLDISDPSNPELDEKEIALGFDIETIFPYKNNLFIGSQSGMHIYDVSTPDAPKHLSTYTHITSCDPVVVQGQYAYVTLRTESACQWGENRLDILDISDLTNPTLVNSYFMESPHGLSVDNDLLFVCEGDNGLKVFDITTPSEPVEIIQKDPNSEISQVHAYDAITLPPPYYNKQLMLIGEDGFFQYDYSEAQDIQKISELLVEK